MEEGAFALLRLAVLSHASEAIAAIDRTIRFGLEGNSCFAAARSADSCEKFSGSTGSAFPGVAAIFAALGFVHEAALCVKLLLTGGEYELLATFLAIECFVLVHCLPSL